MSRLIAVPTKELQKDVDFEIVSFMTIDKEFDYHNFNSYFNEDINTYYKKYENNFIDNLLNEKNGTFKDCYSYGATPMNEVPEFFYKVKDHDTDIDLATSVGLGAVRMLTGEFKGECLLYNIEENVFDDCEITMYDETIRISVYLTLIDETFDDKHLERILKQDVENVSLLLMCNRDKIVERLFESFKNKKGGNNLVEFKKRV